MRAGWLGVHLLRLFLIEVIGFNRNGSRHITQCFTEEEIKHGTRPLLDALARLHARVVEMEGMTP